MRRAFNVFFLLGAASALYFLIGNVLHWTGSGFAIVLSGFCFFSGIFIRVMEI